MQNFNALMVVLNLWAMSYNNSTPSRNNNYSFWIILFYQEKRRGHVDNFEFVDSIASIYSLILPHIFLCSLTFFVDKKEFKLTKLLKDIKKYVLNIYLNIKGDSEHNF